MLGVNKVILIGQVIQDVNVRTTSANKRIGDTLLATNHRFRDKATGEQRNSMQYVKVKFFGDMVSKAQTVIKKNKDLYVEGYIQSSFSPKNLDSYQMEIVVREFQVLYNKENTAQRDPAVPLTLCGDELHDENEWAGNR